MGVVINGTSCHWIDCKSFYGANVHLDTHSAKKQAARYADHWGQGAIVYLNGFCETIRTKIGDCLLLNAHGAIGIELLRQIDK